MEKVKRFEDLDIWKKGVAAAVEIYKIVSAPPLKTDFGFKDQLTRSAVSISNNIAEGFEYSNNKDFIRFLRYAKASCGELRSQLCITMEIGAISEKTYLRFYEDLIFLSKQISSLIKYLKNFEKNKVEKADGNNL